MTSVFFPQTIDLTASAVQLIETSLSNPKVTLDKTGLKSYDSLGNIIAALLAGGQAIETAVQLPAAQSYTQSLQYLISWIANNILTASILNNADVWTDGTINYSELDLSSFITKGGNEKSILKIITETIDAFNHLRSQLVFVPYDGRNVNLWELNNGTVASDFLLAANSLSDVSSVPNALHNLGLTGAIIPFASSTVPNGWLACDGSAVSRTTFANLFNVIGTTYGAGDGSTTFNVPDLQGRVIVGAGAGSGLTVRNLGDKSGEENHTLVLSESPSHNHTGLTGTGTTGTGTTGTGTSGSTTPTASDSGHTHGTATAGGTFMQSSTSGGSSLTTGGTFQQSGAANTATGHASITVSAHTHSVPGLSVPGLSVPALSIPSEGGGGSHNNMQPFGVAKFLIKT